MDGELDPHTLRVAATLIRRRAESVVRDPRLDGLEKLGATRTLNRLATDLEISADHVRPRPRRRGKPKA